MNEAIVGVQVVQTVCKMRDTDWDDLRYFLAVSECGSISAAAQFLNVNHSTVLRRITSLEKKLTVRLFDRIPGGYAMTAAGEELNDRLRGVSDQIEAAQRHLSGRDARLSGVIRITTTDTLAHGVLMPVLSEFRAVHPAIQLQVVINNTFLSLTKREADVALRPSNAVPENLVGRRVGRIRTAAYASKSYLKAHGRRKKLDEYVWVAPDDGLAHLAQSKWMREHVPDERIVMRLDSLYGMAEAVRQGIGAGLLLCLLAQSRDELVPLGDAIEELDTDLWLLLHPDLRQVPRIKKLCDFLYAKLSASDSVVRS